MSNTALLQRVPAGARDAAYLAILVAGFGLGAIQTAYLAADYSQPQWLVIAFAVYAYVSGAFGLTASQNVDRAPKPTSTSGSTLDPDPADDTIATDEDMSLDGTLDYETEDAETGDEDEPIGDHVADEYEGRRVAETEDY